MSSRFFSSAMASLASVRSTPMVPPKLVVWSGTIARTLAIASVLGSVVGSVVGSAVSPVQATEVLGPPAPQSTVNVARPTAPRVVTSTSTTPRSTTTPTAGTRGAAPGAVTSPTAGATGTTAGSQATTLPVRLVLRLSERRVYLYRGDRPEKSYPVAIGKPSTPTPTGRYQVVEMVRNPVWRSPWTGQVAQPGENSALGLRWIGFNRLSNGTIGFHGTPTVNSIGRAASNGCVRMYNRDVVELFEQVQVGTPVDVVN